MIAVSFNKEKYFYDVHSLVRAFYPGEEVVCFVRWEKEIETDPERFALAVDLAEEQGSIAVTFVPGSRYPDRAGKKREAYTRRSGCALPADGERESSIDFNPLTDGDGRRVYRAKNALKRLLYRMLEEETGKSLPWGSLTGIRPTHIPKTLYEAGWESSAILRELSETFFVSKEKAALAVEIADRERRILEEEDYESGYSLYIGIPFCPTTCLYCSFPSWPIAGREKQVEEYLDALMKEMDFVAKRFREKTLYTVYFGGGTPTTLSPGQSERLLQALEERFDLSAVKELTVEAGRPDSLTAEKLAVLNRHHVTRISVNPQSMQQRTLDLIGRRHTAEDVHRAFHLARACGDFRINMDLILGLPGERAADVKDTLDQVAALGPDDLTLHALALKRGSRMQALAETKGVTFPAFTDIEEASALAQAKAREMGLAPYYLYRQKNIAGNLENTGFAREDAIGLYNILINEDVHSIVALGAGAISKCVRGDLVTRAENVKELGQYLERIDEMIGRKRALYSE